MANFSAIMILFRFYIGMPMLIIIFLSLAEGSSQTKSKRQIYREQVLPSSGGKIPEGAFRADRLALNRLNKEGIAVPDGITLEHRHVHSHPHYNKHDPEDEAELVKIIQRPENRFVAPEGTYHHERPLTVSSTYLIRKPIGREETNIRTPQQQMTLHEFLAQKEEYGQYESYQYPRPEYEYQHQHPPPPPPPPPPPVAHHPNRHGDGWPPPVSYQHLEHSVAYYPIPVPFELPNKETLKDEYYVKDHKKSNLGYREPEDIHSVINWPYLLGRYTQLAEEINQVTNHDSYEYSDPHSFFFNPDLIEPFDYYESKDRFIRKSKEGNQNPASKRRLVKIKCTNGSENSVEGGSKKCRIIY